MMRTLGSTRKPFAYRPRVEPLEDRLAPATLVNPSTLTYRDSDGDNVTVKISKPLFVQATINAVFDFDAGSVDQSNALGQRLEAINLINLGAAVSGLSLTLTAVQSPVNGGDGFANVGLIDANAIDLKAVTIDGDLSQMVAGDSMSTTPAIVALTVQSMGATSDGHKREIVLEFQGRVGAISVKSDVVGVTLQTHGNSGPDDVNATIDSITIGGSLIGVGLGSNSGLITAGGNIGLVKIGGNVIGAGGANSGQIMSLESIQRVKIGGSVMGGSGPAQDVLGDGSLLVGAGSILSMKAMGRVTIGGDLVGADGPASGIVATGAILFPVFIVNGSIRGGGGAQSGSVFSGGDMGLMSVGVDLIGGAGAGSGAVHANGNLAGITIGRSVLGGSGVAADVLGDGSLLVGAGSILSMKTIGMVTIGGDLVGGDGPGSGVIADLQGSKNPSEPTAGIKGSIRGGVGAQSGLMFSGGDMGLMTVGVDIIGGAGAGSGAVRANGNLAGITMGRSVLGGSGAAADVLGDGSMLVGAGSILSMKTIGMVTIGGDLVGGDGAGSGVIADLQGSKDPAEPTSGIKGSIRGGGGAQSGWVFSGGDMGLMTVGVDIVGGAGGGSGAVRANGNLAGITIGRSLVGGSGAAADVLGDGSLLVGAGSILSMKTIGMVTIGGDLVGGDGPGSGVVVDIQGDVNPAAPCCAIKGSIRGGGGAQSGWVFSGGDMGLMSVGVDIVGGAGAGSGAVRSVGRLAGLTVGGSISSGAGADSGSLRAGDDLGAIVVKGNLIGSAANPVVIAGRGQADAAPKTAADLAIASVKVGGRAEFANILAGVNLNGGGVNADAQIGKLKVTGDWIASSLAAGVSSGDGFFGNGDDGAMSGPDVKDSPSISSQIGKIVIGGAILGTPAGLDHYGFAAELVLALTQGDTKLPVQAGAHGDDLLLAANTGDVRLREV